jgi:hypothetical protein
MIKLYSSALHAASSSIAAVKPSAAVKKVAKQKFKKNVNAAAMCY